MTNRMVKLLSRGDNGAVEETGVELNLEEDLGGEVPQVGDRIVETRVHGNLDPGDAIKRMFYIIEPPRKRPGADGEEEVGRIDLVCRIRYGSKQDQAAFA